MRYKRLPTPNLCVRPCDERHDVSEDKDRIILDQRYSAVLASYSDDALSALAVALDDDLRTALAKVAGLPATAFDSPASLGGLIRDGIARRRAAHDVGILLSEPCTRHSIEALGDASDDPTLEELQGLLPSITEKFGLEAVRLMVVQYSRSLKGFKQLIAADDRFALPVAAGIGVLEKDEAEQAAKRAARKERKQREREADRKRSGKR